QIGSSFVIYLCRYTPHTLLLFERSCHYSNLHSFPTRRSSDLGDEKELSEHRMLVDLGRNDVNRVSEQGSVELNRLMEIERYEHVMHIVSVVTGKVKKDISPIDVVTSLLPTCTVSGAPKLRAIERIYEVRPEKRGIYSGGVGYINCNQELDFALAIRTMLVDDDYVNVEAGCGVVFDSVPEKELEETKLKVKSLLEVHP